MKVRNGFVSNSSASSFIVSDKNYLDSINVNYKELTPEQILLIVRDCKEIEKLSGNFYLTQYISDGYDEHWELKKYGKSDIAVEYNEGNHGNPYDIEKFDILEDIVINNYYDNKVYILKKHNEKN